MKSGSNATGAANPTGPRNAWTRFWFSSTDPTTLGFMRIVTGLLVIYVHLAYCFDLNAFFGRDGYWPTALANRERHETPLFVHPYDWNDMPASVRMPDYPHRRQAVMDFYRALPERLDERKLMLRFV